MLRKLVRSTLAAALLGAFLAVVPVAAPAAHAATSPPLYVRQWGTLGTGNSQFNTPRGVAVDGSGNVYVADTYNHRIQKFTATGTYLTQWGTNGTGNGQFNQPQGVAVDATGNVYVADTYNHRIQTFTATGTYLTQWGTYGTGNGQFSYPRGVSTDGSGNVYIVDTMNHRLQTFTATGTYLTQWGTNGTGNGQFNQPRGVAVDGSGNVFVADRDNDRIQTFTTTGTYLTQWGTNGTGNGQFDTPEGVAVDATGRIQVVDTYNHRIEVFEPTAPSLTVTKAADEATVVAGSPIHYHVTITNTGNVPLTGVTVTDTRAPACAGGLADIAVGTNRVVDCTYTTTPSDIGTYANTATVDTNETDAIASNTVDVTVNAAVPSELAPVFIRTWGTDGFGPGQFYWVLGIGVGPDGSVYVSDGPTNQRIEKFTADGTYVTQWGPRFGGTGAGQFNLPTGIAVDPAGNVYVADTNNNRIQKFTADGAYLTQWGGAGSGAGQFDQPFGVAVDGTGHVYVADRGNHRIQEFTDTGTFVRQWGGAGTGSGEFNLPQGIAVGPDGHVYVTDVDNNRVQEFDGDGTYVRQWGNVGTGNGQFQGPSAVATDRHGDVYVTDASRVQKFSATGTYLTQWGEYGTGTGQFRGTSGIAVSPTGNVYVGDGAGYRVEQFAPSAVRGTVTETGTGTPLEGSWAIALRASDFSLVGGGATDAQGRYVVPVAPGTYRVEFVDPRLSHEIEWYDNHPYGELAGSDPISTTIGAATTANAVLDDPTGTIEGTITDATTGDPLDGAGVAVLRAGASQPLAAVSADTQGHYQISGLAPGGYVVVAALAAGTNHPWFYGDTHDVNEATVVTVTMNSREVADISPPRWTGSPPTETLSGTVTDDVTGGPEAGILVGALRRSDFEFTVATFTDTDGHYALTVAEDDYYLEFFDLDTSHHFEWYDDQPDPTAATDLTVVHAPAAADAALTPLEGTIAGSVTETGAGTPIDRLLPGVWVAAIGVTDYQPVAGVISDSGGNYTLADIDIGDYYVVFIDPTGYHQLRFHHDSAGMDTATPVTVTGSHTTAVSAGLPRSP